MVDTIPGTDISIAKLNRELRYINETFGTVNDPLGIRVTGISLGSHPHLRIYDVVSMSNPFSGSCNGYVLASGATVPEDGTHSYVKHEWHFYF